MKTGPRLALHPLTADSWTKNASKMLRPANWRPMFLLGAFPGKDPPCFSRDCFLPRISLRRPSVVISNAVNDAEALNNGTASLKVSFMVLSLAFESPSEHSKTPVDDLKCILICRFTGFLPTNKLTLGAKLFLEYCLEFAPVEMLSNF